MLTTYYVILFYFLLSALIYMALMIYYRNGINNVISEKSVQSHHDIFVSIVICFRNEEHHLPELLKGIAEQHFDKNKYEILLYNDASTDGSVAIIKNFQMQHPSIKIIYYDAPQQQGCNSSKKLSINHAATHSQAALMVITDADCIFNENWLKTLVHTYCNKKAKLIAAPVAIAEKGQWIEQLQSYEMVALTAVTAGAIGHKKAMMCNGANMAFDRKVFLDLNPYKDNLQISSGDDMFLLLAMQQWHGNSIEFVAHQDAVVFTYAKTNLKEYLHQRVRWASKSKNYHENYIKLIALIVLNMNTTLLFSPLILCFSPFKYGLTIITVMLLIKQFADYLCLKKYAATMHLKLKYVKLFCFQYVEALLTFLVALKSIKGSYIWKNRKQHF